VKEMQKIKCSDGKCYEPKKKSKECDEEDIACQIEKDLDKEILGEDADVLDDDEEEEQ
jgi:hypothetical protein